MVTAEFARLMARYNKWQNNALLNEVNKLSAEERERDRGAFFGSIHGTLAHLLWADLLWLSRFGDWQAPKCGVAESASLYSDWSELAAARVRTDDGITDWASRLTDEDLSGELAYHSVVLDKLLSKPWGECVTHFFNHQTHHRGQIHAMLTAAGAQPTDTDLVLMPEEF